MADTIKLTKVLNHYNHDMAAVTCVDLYIAVPLPLCASISCVWNPTGEVIQNTAWLN